MAPPRPCLRRGGARLASVARVRISVVTPSLNQGRFLDRTIRSVLDQGYPDLEYFVVDGGSRDESIEILRRYGDRLTGWVSEPDAGQADAIAKGFRRCTGDLLAYLNSSDEYPPDAFRRVADAARRRRAALYYGDVVILDEESRPLDVESAAHLDLETMVYESVFPFQPGAFWSREDYEKCGGMDPSFHVYMDFDLMVRLARTGPMCYVPAPLGCLRRHWDAKTGQFARRWSAERARIVRTYASTSSWIRGRRILCFLKRAGRFAAERRWYEVGKMIRKARATWKPFR